MAKGMSGHLKRIKNAQNVAQHLTRGLYKAGTMIELDAERSITEGAISGKNHAPSLPGQPPNADTRHLDANIETTIKADASNPTVEVTSKATYAAALEFGTSKMAARPYMRPATEKNRKAVTDLAGKAVSIAIRRG